jgi:hypothetical protein
MLLFSHGFCDLRFRRHIFIVPLTESDVVKDSGQ